MGQKKGAGLTDYAPDIDSTHSKHISEEGRRNRDVLIDAMTKAGFANLRSEWWHWLYGDRMWAYYAKQPYAIYGSR